MRPDFEKDFSTRFQTQGNRVFHQPHAQRSLVGSTRRTDGLELVVKFRITSGKTVNQRQGRIAVYWAGRGAASSWAARLAPNRRWPRMAAGSGGGAESYITEGEHIGQSACAG